MSTQRTNFGPLFQGVGKGFDVAKAREVMGRPATTAPHNRTDTSRQAATAIAPHVQAQEAQVLAYLRQCGAMGSTQHEAAASLGLSLQSMCGRFHALADPRRPGGPLIEVNGRTRPTPSNRPARVYVARRSDDR